MSLVGILSILTGLLVVICFLVWAISDRLREIRDELISFRRQFPDRPFDEQSSD